MFIGDTGDDEGFRVLESTLYTIITRGLRKHMKSFSLLSYKEVDHETFIKTMLGILNHGTSADDEKFTAFTGKANYGHINAQDIENEILWKTSAASVDMEHKVIIDNFISSLTFLYYVYYKTI